MKKTSPVRRLMSLTILIAVSVVSHGAAKADDECKPILAGGVFDSLSIKNKNYSSNEFHRALCEGVVKSKGESRAGGGGGEISVGIPGIVEIDLGGSGNSARQFVEAYRRNYCESTGSKIITDSDVDFFQAAASPEILSAYRTCIQARKNGLSVDLKRLNDSVTVDLRFRKNSSTDAASYLGTYVTPKTAAECLSTNLRKGEQLGEDARIITCRRTGTAGAEVVVHTTAGSYTFQVYPKVPPPSDTDIVLAALPRGTILPFYGRPDDVPHGWQICNGKQGTLDLVGRFPMGDSGDKVGASGDGKLVIPSLEVNTTAVGFGAAKDNTPKIGPWEGEHWGRVHPATSKGATVPKEVTAVPAHVRILYIMKVR
jgi:hypothetical protein